MKHFFKTGTPTGSVALATRRVGKLILLLLVAFYWQLPSVFAVVDAPNSSWIKQAPIPTSFSVQGITALSPSECWIASAPLLGDVGELAHTTDAGRTWTVVEMPRQVNAIFFIDSLHGWAAGNAFFHTTNGGLTWIQDNILHDL
jgi:photosystem II stability/assembly factor-like uncharacterized protein